MDGFVVDSNFRLNISRIGPAKFSVKPAGLHHAFDFSSFGAWNVKRFPKGSLMQISRSPHGVSSIPGRAYLYFDSVID